MQLHELKPTHSQPTSKRVGRGGKRGKTSGRGHKGQNARAGNSGRPEMRELIKKLPKLRGHGTNRSRTVNGAKTPATVVNLSVLATHFDAGATVSPRSLVAKGIVNAQGGRPPAVKILGTGDISVALTVEKCTVSEAARTKIEAAGGTTA